MLRRILVEGMVAALVIGTAVAAIGSWLAGRDSGGAETGLAPPASSPAPAKASARTFDCSLPKPSDFARIDPSYSPEITDITAIDRTRVRLRWVDRSGRVDVFFVSRVCQDGRMTNSTHVVPYSVTEYVFSGLDPATAPYCFNVVSWNSDFDFQSETRCISPPR